MRSIVRASKRGFTLIELMIVVAIVGILAVLAIYGVRKYLANAKTAEARNCSVRWRKDQATEFEKESMAGDRPPGRKLGGDLALALRIATERPVPAAMTCVKGKKYQSNRAKADWNVGPSRRRTRASRASSSRWMRRSTTCTASRRPAPARPGDTCTRVAQRRPERRRRELLDLLARRRGQRRHRLQRRAEHHRDDARGVILV